jgi:TP901 family phage tail tape measure protein
MAGNNYRLLLEAQLDPQKIQAQINALSNKSVMNIKMNFAQGDMAKFEAELEKIKSEASSIGKVTLFGDNKGGINRAVIEYKDALGNVVQAYKEINPEVEVTQKYTENLAKDEKEINSLLQKRLVLNAKQADEMERAGKEADMFLEKSKNLASTPSVQNAIGKATDLKNAVSEGDIAKVRKFKDELDLAKASLQTGRTGLDSWSEGMRNAIKQTIEYATSIGLVYGALNQIKQGIQYLTDLDKEMTNVQIVTGATDEEIANLSFQYNGLAKQMGTTTLEVAKGSLEWRRQGKSAQEAGELVQSTMMLSKLGNLDAAQSTEYLTSIINGFKLEAKDTQDVVSKLVALDNEFATSAGEISSAMQRSSVSAQQAGVSMEELASMITVVSDVSRRAPESIGESFKTMFARYQDILSGQVDEEGMGINNVGKALERVGINIRDAEGGFRDFSDVLDDLYPKWASLNEVEQANILKALAGTRQRESLLILLENETKYRKALTVQMESEGLAAERYATYLDSVEAAQNRLKSTWEDLIMSSATGDMIKNFYDGTSSVLNFIDALGGIPTILKIAIPLLIIFNAELIKTNYLALGTSLNNMSVSIVAFGKNLSAAISLMKSGSSVTSVLSASMSTAAITATAFVLAIGSLLAVIYEYNEQIVKTQKIGIEENADQWGKIFNSIKKDGTDATEVLNTYKEAVKGINDAHEQGGLIADIFVDKTKLIGEGLKETVPLIEENTKSYQDYKKSIEEAAKTAGLMIDEEGKFYKEGAYGKKFYIDGVDALTESEWRAKYASQALTEQIQGEKEIYDEYLPTIGQIAAEYVGFSDTLSLLSDNLDTVNSLIEKSMQGTLSFTDIKKIPAEYLDALTVEGDKLKLNIDIIKQKQLAEAEMSYQAVLGAQQRGEASAQEVEVIRLYYNQLLEQSQATYGQFGQTAWQYDQLLWTLANDAYTAGAQIVGLEGQALTSAQNIFDYISSGDQAFNDFVRQVANITGQSVEQVMNQINGMIQTTTNNAAALINYLGASSLGVDSGFNHAPPAPPQVQNSLFSGVSLPSPVSYGGGGGSRPVSNTNSELEHQRDLENQINEIEKQIEEARQNAVDDLKDQLDVYKDIIDARKEIIDTLADEREYQQDVENKNKEILRVQNELATLQFDTSEEANARRLELEDQLANLTQELENIHYDQSVEVQKNALDDEYKAMEDRINSIINQIENINATSVTDFANQLATIMSSFSLPPKGESNPHDTIPTFHDGAKSGVVGNGLSLKSNELFAKLMAGEVVSNSSQIDSFMNKTLPQIAEGSSSFVGGNIELNMPVNINGGNGDSIIPDLDKFAEKLLVRLQQMMNQRGWNRRGDLFQI